MKTEYITLKETEINSNCPECYATDGLILSFKQQKKTSKFMTNFKNQVIERMYCTKCENDIFPGRYTDDIQRIYDYHKKTISPISSRIQLSTVSYIILALLISIIIVAFIFIQYPNIFKPT